jgi:glycosyltransferase involved in cell wall biosynthesis
MAYNRGNGEELDVFRVLDGTDDESAPTDEEVIGNLIPGSARSIGTAAERLASFDAAILQHEYGIWGPDSGKAVLDLAEKIEVPLITILHTVGVRPNETHRYILERLAALSLLTAVPTRSAQRVLIDRYRIDPRTTAVIPHGTHSVHRNPFAKSSETAGSSGSAPALLTWGLIGPGKGLESALKAVALLRRRFPGLRYVIVGRTHPKVLDAHGEAYRLTLQDMAERLDLSQTVEFINDYLPRESLNELLRATDVVVLPYESSEQVVSGVLVEAVAASVPIVATAFSHAVELAEQGAVAVTPNRSPEALADAIAGLLDSPARMGRVVEAQRRLAPSLEWTSVAAQYEQVVHEVTQMPAAV